MNSDSRGAGIWQACRALALDYDGTLATDGRVDESALAALRRYRAAGPRLILVTGRILEELKQVCPRLDLFDLVVAENGGVLFEPATGVVELLGPALPDSLVEHAKIACRQPIQLGQVVLATWEPEDHTFERLIDQLQLDWHVVRNKRAVMILPKGVDKASGLRAAAQRLGLDLDHCAGCGDAENDLAFVEICGLPVAVANAIDALKAACAWTTHAPRTPGVIELIDRLLAVRN